MLDLSGWTEDLRYASRSLRKHPAFVVLVTLILGLGIGAGTAVYSVLQPLLLQPLPFEQPDRLVWVANSGSGGMSSVTSRASNLRDFRRLNRSFDGLTGYNAFFEQTSHNLLGQGEPMRLVAVDVAHDFLQVLGVQPMLGRSFSEEEGLDDGPPAVILTHGLWQQRFASDPAIVGQAIRLDTSPYTVVGVLPPSFDFPAVFAPGSRVDLLLPFPISDETDRWGNTLSMIGRLKPGVTVASAQGDLDAILVGLEEDDPERWGLGAKVSGLQSQVARPFQTGFFLLAAAAATVLLIVCVNVSNLMLARGPKRYQEMTLRSALGAPRGRLLRLLILESLMLSLGGAAVGTGLAVVLTRLVASSQGIQIPLLQSVAVDRSALIVAVLLALISGLGAGLLPALRAVEGGQATALRDASRSLQGTRRSTRLLESLVVSEVALACLLLVVGGLLFKSFLNVLDVDLGFEPSGLVAWQLNTAQDFESATEAAAFFAQVTDEVQAIPGVESVGLTDAAPLGLNRTWSLRAPGVEYGDNSYLSAFPHLVDTGYLETMQIPLLEGRHFTADDTEEREYVVILNQSAADAVYRGEDPLNRIVDMSGLEVRVVGIVADVRHRRLEAGQDLEMYFPISQIADYGTLDLMVRSQLPESALTAAVGTALNRVDPTMPTTDHRTVDALVQRASSPRRFTLILLGAFSLLALLLAALGIYGVLSYLVTSRRPEIGIRMALGATHHDVLGDVLGRTLRLASLGVALGAGAAFLSVRLLDSLLYGVAPTDVSTFLLTACLLLTVAALSGLLPGLRASRTDPTTALRSS